MSVDFNELPDRVCTESVKWHHFDEDVLPMWVADMDFPSPEPVIQALQKRVAHGIYGYPCEPTELRESVVDWLAERHHWQVENDWLVFIPGVVTGINMAGQAFAQPGEGILIQPPVYMPFLTVPRNAGAICQEAGLARQPDGSYQVDFDVFESAITDQTRLFILCNPHNPVGRVFTQDELSRMAEICLRHNVLICADEIHSDLVFSGHRHIPIASLDGAVAQQTLTLIAPSKTFNIAGLACSVAVIPNAELRSKFLQAGKGMVHGVNLLGLVAAQAAYRGGAPWLADLMTYLEANRDVLFDVVNQHLPGVKMNRPEGTYLAWLDCAGANIEGDPAKFFLEKARVALNDGRAFGKGGEDFVRLNFGCPRSMLLESLERMRAALLEKEG